MLFVDICKISSKKRALEEGRKNKVLFSEIVGQTARVSDFTQLKSGPCSSGGRVN